MGVQAATVICSVAGGGSGYGCRTGLGKVRVVRGRGGHHQPGGLRRGGGGGPVSARASFGARPVVHRSLTGAAGAATDRSSRHAGERPGHNRGVPASMRAERGDGSCGSAGREESFSSSRGAVGGPDDVPGKVPFRFPDTDFLTGGGDDGPIGNQAEAIVKGNSAAVLERSLNPDGGAADLDYLQELIAIQSGGPKAIGRVAPWWRERTTNGADSCEADC